MAQDSISLRFTSILKSNEVKLEQPLTFDEVEVTTTRLRYYIGNIRLVNDSQIMQVNTPYKLWDLATPNSQTIKICVPSIGFKQLAFDLGIDSLTNVSGALEGDLDPTKGMYWTWQSGYINFKWEGTINKTEKFEYHIGGYLPPFQTVQKIIIPSAGSQEIEIMLNLDNVLKQILKSDKKRIMSPGKEAQFLSQILSRGFRIHEE